MQFCSLEYAVFLSTVFAVFWAMAKLRLTRTIFLLLASYLFYATQNPWCLISLGFSSSLDYWVGRGLEATERRATRKLLLWSSIIVNLGILATLKYFNFFSESAAWVLQWLDVSAEPVALDVLLPVGISFYTFQTLGYVIEVYRKRLAAERSYLRYLLFVSFFPCLLAGPIMRASSLLPQLGRPPAMRSGQGEHGLFLIMVGIVKKVAIADFLALTLVDRVFDFPERFSSLEVLVAIYAYALQITCDFSGYSDIAIGSAKLLGIDLMQNFDKPYLATSPRDFWNRWHISLSSWLRDYLYFSMGGSRRSFLVTARNLMITMLVCGLWHYPSWTFIAWGAMHGLMLVFNRIWLLLFPPRKTSQTGFGWRKLASGILTFHFVCLAWVFFRAESFSSVWAILLQLGQITTFVVNVPLAVWLVLLLGSASQVLPRRLDAWALRTYQMLPAPLQAAVFTGILVSVQLAFTQPAVPFIYSQY